MKKVLLTMSVMFLALTTQVFAQDESDITIYVSASCIHCQRVEAFISENDLGVYVNYVSVDTDEGLEELQGVWEEVGAADSEKGWPFMIYTVDGVESYLVGDEPINDYLAQKYDIDIAAIQEEEKKSAESSNNAVMLIGGVFFVAILGFSAYSLISGKKES